MDEQKLGNMAVEFESAVEWEVNVIGDENCMGDWEDLPIDFCEENNM